MTRAEPFDWDAEDHQLLEALERLARELGGGPPTGRALDLRDAVRDRLRSLARQAAAAAEATARGVELLEQLERLGGELSAQNARLREQTERLHARQRDAEQLITALAEANAAAVVEADQALEARLGAEAAQRRAAAQHDRLAEEAAALRRQVGSLADANVDLLLGSEAQARQLEELRLACAREEALKARFREEALHDAMTGLHNRRHYEERLEAEFARATRHQRELSVLFVDADHFKRFNDVHGHAAGDAVLAELARLLRVAIRGSDLVARGAGDGFAARYGGEEFVVLLPETSLSGALRVGERVRALVESTPVRVGPEALAQVTVSVGVAALQPEDRAGAELVRRADLALYRAKREGRNRVAVEPGEPCASA